MHKKTMKFKYKINILKKILSDLFIIQNINDNSNEADERNDSDEYSMNSWSRL